MTVAIEIKTDLRRVIDYLLSPLARIASEAGRERLRDPPPMPFSGAFRARIAAPFPGPMGDLAELRRASPDGRGV
jgi:hypothetical protein